MIYRLDRLSENNINPITGQEYDNTWMVLMLTDSLDYQQMSGSSNGCAYTIKVSRSQCKDWKMPVGDFIGFCEANEKNAILAMSETDFKSAKDEYEGHRYNEPLLRDGCHLKVKDMLPLKPYLIWTATWETIGLASQISTPKNFAEQADKQFQSISQYPSKNPRLNTAWVTNNP